MKALKNKIFILTILVLLFITCQCGFKIIFAPDPKYENPDNFKINLSTKPSELIKKIFR